MESSCQGEIPGAQVYRFARHKPERTLLYQLVERHWPEFVSRLEESGSYLPKHVTQEFEEYLTCGRVEHGFLRVCCD